jgi:hypothetical protein
LALKLLSFSVLSGLKRNLENLLTFKKKQTKLISKQSKESKERLTLSQTLSDSTLTTEY